MIEADVISAVEEDDPSPTYVDVTLRVYLHETEPEDLAELTGCVGRGTVAFVIEHGTGQPVLQLKGGGEP